MNSKRRTRTALCLLMILTVSAPADQQVVYPPSAMPRVDMHTHMDAKTQYAKAVVTVQQLAEAVEDAGFEARLLGTSGAEGAAPQHAAPRVSSASLHENAASAAKNARCEASVSAKWPHDSTSSQLYVCL